MISESSRLNLEFAVEVLNYIQVDGTKTEIDPKFEAHNRVFLNAKTGVVEIGHPYKVWSYETAQQVYSVYWQDASFASSPSAIFPHLTMGGNGWRCVTSPSGAVTLAVFDHEKRSFEVTAGNFQTAAIQALLRLVRQRRYEQPPVTYLPIE